MRGGCTFLAVWIALCLADAASAVEDQGDFCERLTAMLDPQVLVQAGTEVTVIVPDVYLFKVGPDELRDGAGEVDPLPALRNTLDTVCICFTDKNAPLIDDIRKRVKGNPSLKFTVLERAVLVTTGDHLERFKPVIAYFMSHYDKVEAKK